MHRVLAVISLVVSLATLRSPAWAQPQLPPDSSLTLGTRVWVTTGNSTNSTGLSELRWRGVDSVVPEVNAEFVWRRWVFMASLGGGAIKEGVLIDEDFNDSDHDVRISR